MIARAVEVFDDFGDVLVAPGEVLLPPPVVDEPAQLAARHRQPIRARMHSRRMAELAVVLVQRTAALDTRGQRIRGSGRERDEEGQGGPERGRAAWGPGRCIHEVESCRRRAFYSPGRRRFIFSAMTASI